MVTINGLIIHVDILVGNIWIISLCVKNNFDRKNILDRFNKDCCLKYEVSLH